MKKLAFILLTAVFTFPLFANNPSDTTIVIENRKIQVIDEENRLRVRVFERTEENDYVEQQLVFEGHYRDGVVHERRHISRTVSIPVPATQRARRERRFDPHWTGIGFGFNHFASDDVSLNAMRSMEFTWNIHERAVPFSRNFGLVSGVGLTWNRFHLSDNVHFVRVDGVTVVRPADEGVDFTRTRLGINSITVPVLFEWQIRTQHNRRNYLYFSAGAVGNWNYMSRAKVRFDNPQGQRRNETTRGRDLNVRPLTVDFMAQVGISNWGAIYAKYRPLGLFENDRGPAINPVSLGIMLHL
ncbi:MAG: PorT family protein [Tannerella sp.]|jgi:hypothetical protein|nr:PorT family protein [Tannerella sp.]